MIELRPLELVGDFQEGDFLYGLETTRVMYRRAILDKIRQDRARSAPERAGRPIYETVDRIHNAVGSKIFYTDEYLLSPGRDFDTPVKVRVNSLLEEGNPFHPENAKINQLEFNSPSDRKIIASCKQALIEHIGKVRFCLDGIDLDHARNPEHKYFRNFTSCELLFCAHNWDKAKDVVVFYNNGQKVDPPWNAAEDVELWLRSYKEDANVKKKIYGYGVNSECADLLKWMSTSPGNNNNQGWENQNPNTPSPKAQKRLRFDFSCQGNEDSESEDDKERNIKRDIKRKLF